jgi:hypothetical protein
MFPLQSIGRLVYSGLFLRRGIVVKFVRSEIKNHSLALL